MKYYVFHEDDYAECGGVGLKEFDSEELANAFIIQRIESDPLGRSVKDYTLLHGEIVKMEMVDTDFWPPEET